MAEQVNIGPYTLLNKIGYGGMAVVYHATDTRDGKEVALKILLPQYYNDHAFLRRFAKEGLNAQRLNHPNIVRTYSAGEDDGFHYIAMEYIDGATLEEYIAERGPLSLNDTLRILAPIGSALDYAHELGYIHRDMKLNNIMRSKEGRYLLTDFGVSKHLSTDMSMMTGMGQSIGTPSYMSPEQARGERVADSKSDIYSLGVMAYRLLTGQVPFSAPDPFELAHKIIFFDPIDPRQLNQQLDSATAKALKQVLAKEPAERPATCSAFVDSLSGLEEEKSSVGFNFSPTNIFRSVLQAKPNKEKPQGWPALELRLLAPPPRPRPGLLNPPPAPSHRRPQEHVNNGGKPQRGYVEKSQGGQNRVEQNRVAQNQVAQNQVEQNRVAQNQVAQNQVEHNQFAEKINAEHVHALRTDAYAEVTQPGMMRMTPDDLDNGVEEAAMMEGTQALTMPVTMHVDMLDVGKAEPAVQMKSMTPKPHLPETFIAGDPLPGQPHSGQAPASQGQRRRKRATTVLTRAVRPRNVYADFREDGSGKGYKYDILGESSSRTNHDEHSWFDPSQRGEGRSWGTLLDDSITLLYRVFEPLTRRFRKRYNLD